MNNLVKVSVPIKQNDKQMATSGANPSGSGVFYQAMPAVGADGKNVMKLIPVQRVNGQFVRTETPSNLPSAYRKPDVHSQRMYTRPIHFSAPVSQNRFPILQPALNGGYVLKRPSDVNVVLNPVATAGRYQERVTMSTGTPIRVHVPIVPTKVGQNPMPVATPVLNCGKTITLLNKKQLPVAVKSPVLPNGHYLQIPPDAQVKTLPASALPQAIKKRILTTPVSSSPGASGSGTSLPTVVYVSPVNTMKLGAPTQGPLPPTAPVLYSRLPKTSSQPSPPRASPVLPPQPLSKDYQGPVTPIKWVVQEDSGSAAPCLVPQNSSSMTSEILKALAQMEKAKDKGESAAANSTSLDNKSTIGPGKDNALVMCNGKVYFVAKKMPELSDHTQRISGSITSPSKCAIGDGKMNQKDKSSPNQLSCSSPGLHISKASRQSRGHYSVNDGVDEIIDLCDDDTPDEFVTGRDVDSALPQFASSTSVAEEDDEDSNVIFVSYIPPKSTVQSTGQEVENKTSPEMIRGEEIGQEMESLTSQENESSPENGTGLEEESEQVAEISQNEGTDQQTSFTETPAITEEGTQNNISENKSQSEMDRQLKKKFGITADIKICLQNIQTSEPKAVSKKVPQIGSINKRTLDGIRKLMQGSRIELKTKKLIETQIPSLKRKNESSSEDLKRKKGQQCENSFSTDMESENTWRRPDSQCPEMEVSSDGEMRDKTVSDTVGREIQAGCPTVESEIQAGCSTVESEIQAGCSTVGREMSAGSSSVGREMSAGSSSVGREMSAGSSSVGREMSAGSSSVGREMSAGSSSVGREMSAGSSSVGREMSAGSSSVGREMSAGSSSVGREMSAGSSSVGREMSAGSSSVGREMSAGSSSVGREMSAGSSSVGREMSAGSSSVGREISPGSSHDRESMETSEEVSKSKKSAAEEPESTAVVAIPQFESGAECGTTSSQSKTRQPKSRKGKGRGKQCRTSEAQVAPGSLVPVDQTEPGHSDTCAVPLVEAYLPDSGWDGAPLTESGGGVTEPALVEISCPSVLNESSSTTAETPLNDDVFTATAMDPEEIRRHEKIKRLKELLKEKEAALEMFRKNMI